VGCDDLPFLSFEFGWFGLNGLRELYPWHQDSYHQPCSEDGISLYHWRLTFDCCDHNILLRKLFKLGIKDTELNWFWNYLTNRQQFLSIGDCKSNLLTVKYGILQGSVLGPILFLLYIKDLPYCSKFLSLLVADDTTLLLSNENIDALIRDANEEFHKIVNFFRLHKLSLHPSKTKFM
jgi:hypothetical protein